jgi:hypothetical protein
MNLHETVNGVQVLVRASEAKPQVLGRLELNARLESRVRSRQVAPNGVRCDVSPSVQEEPLRVGFRRPAEAPTQQEKSQYLC